MCSDYGKGHYILYSPSRPSACANSPGKQRWQPAAETVKSILLQYHSSHSLNEHYNSIEVALFEMFWQTHSCENIFTKQSVLFYTDSVHMNRSIIQTSLYTNFGCPSATFLTRSFIFCTTPDVGRVGSRIWGKRGCRALHIQIHGQFQRFCSILKMSRSIVTIFWQIREGSAACPHPTPRIRPWWVSGIHWIFTTFT
jgi:hypothetical protein